MAAVDLDAALSADSSVSAAAALSWALAAAPTADSDFTPPMLLVTRAFGSLVLADSTFGPSMLSRARPLASPVVADSSSTDTAQMAYALNAAPLADSLSSGALSRARPLAAAPLADSVFGPSFMNSTDGLLSFVAADSQVVADITVVVPLAASVQANSALSSVAPDIYRLPPPNRPQPLPPPAVVPLRIVPNPPKEAEMSVGSPAAPTRRQGL